MELEFYKLPFSDKYKCGYIYDANSNFIFQFETYDTNIYYKPQRKPTCFNRWMNLVNNFIDIFGGLK